MRNCWPAPRQGPGPIEEDAHDRCGSVHCRRRRRRHPTSRDGARSAVRRACAHRDPAMRSGRRPRIAPTRSSLLEEQAASRVPELIPVRHGRMMVSPFTFYRGAALLMAADLATTAEQRIDRAAVRRRAPVELRPVRLAPNGASSSTSTTSTRRIRDRSSGTSSASWRASRSPDGIAASPTRSGARSLLAAGRGYRERMLHVG